MLSSVPYFLVLLFYKCVPESPRYLSAKGRLKEAHEILEKAAQLNRMKLPSDTLVSDQVQNLDEGLSLVEETQLLSSSQNELLEPRNRCRPPTLLSLFSQKYIRTTLLLWFLYFANTFSYYGVILLTSQLSSMVNKCGSITFLSVGSQDSRLYINVFLTSLAGRNFDFTTHFL